MTFRYPDEVRAADLAKREQDVAARRLANPPMPRNADYILKASRKARSIMTDRARRSSLHHQPSMMKVAASA
ncbi:hypothetical protein ACHZ97_09685 [Lysobacter soli]|uniref:hypothetical protein n=1 Tax=Lysobacter soli TaxID=453783 RepID=UPI0037C58E59